MVMKVMRAGTKPILWIVVAAFVGTIIFAWGMDFTSRPAARGVVGEVNGVELKLDDYSFLYQNAIAQRQQQGGELSDEEALQLRDQVFEQMVQNHILTKLIRDLGLSVTNRELAEHLRRFPPPEVQQAQFFQTDGRFDYNKYLDAYNNPDPQLWMQIESLVRPRVLQQKLFEYVSATALVDDAEVRTLYDAATEKLSVRYVLAGTNTYFDSIAVIDSAQIQAYYNDHLDDYRHEERVRLKHATFDKKPSPDDSAVVLREAEDLAARAQAGEDFAELAATFSEDTGTPDGNLGWFKRGAMVKAFEDVAFTLDSGAISDPVVSRFGYHVIKLNGRRGGDSIEVNASHILLRVQPSPSTLSDLRLQTEQFAEEGERGDFETVANNYGVAVGITPFFERDEPGRSAVTSNPAIVDFAFNNKAGAVSFPVETDQSYIVARIDAREPAGITPLAEVEGRIRSRIRTDAAKVKAYESLTGIAAAIGTGASLTAAAQAAGRTLDSTAAFGRYDNLPVLGNDANFRGMAFALTESNPVSPVGRINRGAVIMELIGRTVPDPQEWVTKRDSIMTATLGGKRQMAFNSWYTGIRQATEVKDYRYQLGGGI